MSDLVMSCQTVFDFKLTSFGGIWATNWEIRILNLIKIVLYFSV